MSDASPFIAHNGFALPAQGLGTYDFRGEAGADAVRSGIENGYRLIDSAFNYENEGAVGWGISGAAVDRAELIVTSKLAGRHHARAKALDAIEESRFRLGVEAIDLFLIHWPLPRVDAYVEAWQALIEARERGLVRQIGVSNFLPEHLERIEDATGCDPSSTRSSCTRASRRRKRSPITAPTGSSPRRGARSGAPARCSRIRRSRRSRPRTGSRRRRPCWPGTPHAASSRSRRRPPPSTRR
jgi:diketogulonate reductase-like aldo/keto reductase